MSQFAIITNEGWTELMYDSMRAVSEVDLEYYTSMVTIYFVFSHMFCSLVKHIILRLCSAHAHGNI